MVHWNKRQLFVYIRTVQKRIESKLFNDNEVCLWKKKLIIQPHRYGGETTVISLRLPKEMQKVIDEAMNVILFR